LQVGIIFDSSGKTLTIEDVVVGGPAFNSQQFDPGDQILAIDDFEVGPDSYHARLVGNDAPGEAVKFTLRPSSGQVKEVILRRISTSSLTDRLRLFEMFTILKDDAFTRRDKRAIGHVDEGMMCARKLCQELEQPSSARAYSELKAECENLLRELRSYSAKEESFLLTDMHRVRGGSVGRVSSSGHLMGGQNASRRRIGAAENPDGKGGAIVAEKRTASTAGRIALKNLLQKIEQNANEV
jgi:hypothetical protein